MPLDTSTYALSLLRLDGRRWNELRHMHGAISTQAAVDGSSYLEMGNTKVLCTVTGPAEIRNQGRSGGGSGGGGGNNNNDDRDRAGVHVSISIAGFSGTDRRGRGGGGGGGGSDRRVSEMQSTVQATVAAAVFAERYPRSTIALALHVLAADGGVLAACVNAATLALVDAGIPMADYVCACAAGSTANTLGYSGAGAGAGGGNNRGGGVGGGGDETDDDSNDPLLDLNGQEELELPFLTVGTLGASEKIAFLSLETQVRKERIGSMLTVAVDGCKQVRELLDGIVRRHGRMLLANSVR